MQGKRSYMFCCCFVLIHRFGLWLWRWYGGHRGAWEACILWAIHTNKQWRGWGWKAQHLSWGERRDWERGEILKYVNRIRVRPVKHGHGFAEGWRPWLLPLMQLGPGGHEKGHRTVTGGCQAHSIWFEGPEVQDTEVGLVSLELRVREVPDRDWG